MDRLLRRQVRRRAGLHRGVRRRRRSEPRPPVLPLGAQVQRLRPTGAVRRLCRRGREGEAPGCGHEGATVGGADRADDGHVPAQDPSWPRPSRRRGGAARDESRGGGDRRQRSPDRGVDAVGHSLAPTRPRRPGGRLLRRDGPCLYRGRRIEQRTLGRDLRGRGPRRLRRYSPGAGAARRDRPAGPGPTAHRVEAQCRHREGPRPGRRRRRAYLSGRRPLAGSRRRGTRQPRGRDHCALRSSALRGESPTRGSAASCPCRRVPGRAGRPVPRVRRRPRRRRCRRTAVPRPEVPRARLRAFRRRGRGPRLTCVHDRRANCVLQGGGLGGEEVRRPVRPGLLLGPPAAHRRARPHLS